MEASARPYYQSMCDYSKGFDAIPFGELTSGKQAIWAILRQSMAELHSSRPADAHRSLLGALQMIARQHDPIIIFELVRMAEEPAAFAITWHGLQCGGWDEIQLRQLQEAWASFDFLKEMDRALSMERAMTIEVVERLRNSSAARAREFRKREKDAADETLGGLVTPLPTTGFFFWRINLPLWRFVWIDHDELRLLKKWEPIVHLQRRARTASLTGIKTDLEEPPEYTPTWWERFRFLISSQNSFISPVLVKKTMKTQTEINLAVCAIAIHRFRTATGRLPTTLDQLVPNYLPTLPKDLMNGEPLRYQVDSDHFLLYSVGENGIDDSGDAIPQKGEFRNIWNGKDALWPR
jgi:hypothetical protein